MERGLHGDCGAHRGLSPASKLSPRMTSQRYSRIGVGGYNFQGLVAALYTLRGQGRKGWAFFWGREHGEKRFRKSS